MQNSFKAFFRVLAISLFISGGLSAANSRLISDSIGTKGDSLKKTRHHNGSDDQESGFHPVLRVGGGLLSYIGNVKSGAGSSNFQSPADGRGGFEIGLSQRLTDVTEFGINFLDGTLAETERTTTATWNFKSSIIGGGFNLLFKFLPKQDVTPYVIVGVETFGFSSNADITDASGNPYYTWTDGSLRSLPQNSPEASQAKILNLSYNYSTDIRSLNLGGSGNYSEQTFAIPVGLGFMFRLADQCDFMIGSTLHYTFTDHIDGLTPQVQGPLQGTLSHDMFLFTYISLRIHLTKEHAAPKEEEQPEVSVSPEMLKDTIAPAPEGHFDTSQTVLQKQYEMYSDTAGKFAKVHVDSFHWQNPTPVPVADNATPPATNKGNRAPASSVTPPNKPAAANASTPVTKKGGNANGNPSATSPKNVPVSSGISIYKIQLLATKVKLPDDVNFAGTNDKVAVAESNGIYFYTTGNYTNYADAEKYLEQLKALGYKDAFIKVSKSGNASPAPGNKETPQQKPSGKQGESSMNSHQQPQNMAATEPKQQILNKPVIEAKSKELLSVETSQQKQSHITDVSVSASNNEPVVATPPVSEKKGIEYKVQLGVFTGDNRPGSKFLTMLNQFEDVSIVRDAQGSTHYLVGSYNGFQSAMKARDEAKLAGVKDASISVFNDGNYVSLNKKGVVFKIQLGVFRATPDQKFTAMLKQFKDVSVTKDSIGLNHYMTGSFLDLQGALAARDKAAQAGTKEAFIMAFYNGNKISIPDIVKLQ